VIPTARMPSFGEIAGDGRMDGLGIMDYLYYTRVLQTITEI
jgi:hypothetical protein